MPAPALVSTLYESPQDKAKSLHDDYLYWTGRLTESSFALSLAVIGANWAVFGSVDRVLSNPWSEASIAAVIVSLVINLFGSWKLGGKLRKRIEYAESDPGRWQKEFNEAAGKIAPWPSTANIDRWAKTLRFVRTFLPAIGGACFIFALLFHPNAPGPDQSQPPKGGHPGSVERETGVHSFLSTSSKEIALSSLPVESKTRIRPERKLARFCA